MLLLFVVVVVLISFPDQDYSVVFLEGIVKVKAGVSTERISCW